MLGGVAIDHCMCAHFTCGSLYCLDMAAKEAAEVARRCEDAKVSKELLLDRCGLRKFPDAIFFLLKHIGIAKVDLSRNELVRIPSKFGMVFSSVAGNFLAIGIQRFGK